MKIISQNQSPHTGDACCACGIDLQQYKNKFFSNSFFFLFFFFYYYRFLVLVQQYNILFPMSSASTRTLWYVCAGRFLVLGNFPDVYTYYTSRCIFFLLRMVCFGFGFYMVCWFFIYIY